VAQYWSEMLAQFVSEINRNVGSAGKTLAASSLKEASANDLSIYKQITDNYFRGLNKG